MSRRDRKRGAGHADEARGNGDQLRAPASVWGRLENLVGRDILGKLQRLVTGAAQAVPTPERATPTPPPPSRSPLAPARCAPDGKPRLAGPPAPAPPLVFRSPGRTTFAQRPRPAPGPETAEPVEPAVSVARSFPEGPSFEACVRDVVTRCRRDCGLPSDVAYAQLMSALQLEDEFRASPFAGRRDLSSFYAVHGFLHEHLPALFVHVQTSATESPATTASAAQYDLFWRRMERIQSLLQSAGPIEEIPGALTHGTAQGRDLLVKIGIDFGTSSIKAVYRTEGARRDVSRAVVFDPHAPGIHRYLFEDRITLRDRTLCWGQAAADTPGVSWKKLLNTLYHADLKWTDLPDLRALRDLPLFKYHPAWSDELLPELVEFYTALHLAMALHRIRRFVLADLPQRGIRAEPGFMVCMCVPVKYFQSPQLKENPTCFVNRAALLAADRLLGLIRADQFERKEIPLQTAWEKWLEACRSERLLDLDPAFVQASPVQLRPEVCAATASYWGSRAARPGCYLLVDVGAGTVDVSAFMCVESHEAGNTNAPVFAADCLALGVEELVSRLLKIVPLEQRRAWIRTWLEQRGPVGCPGQLPFPSFPGDVAVRAAGEEVLARHVRQIAEMASGTWGLAFAENRKISKGKRELLTVFLGGGGANVRNMHKLTEGFENHAIISSCNYRELPLPDDFEWGDSAHGLPFHRLSVAYGLSLFFDEQHLPRQIPRLPAYGLNTALIVDWPESTYEPPHPANDE